MTVRVYTKTKANLEENITDNFKLKELACSCKQCTITFLSDRLLQKLQKLREKYNKPIQINSGYRCPANNWSCGGSKFSYHMRGMAVDIKKEDGLFELAKQFFPVVIEYDTFIHCDIGSRRKW